MGLNVLTDYLQVKYLKIGLVVCRNKTCGNKIVLYFCNKKKHENNKKNENMLFIMYKYIVNLFQQLVQDFLFKHVN